MSRSHCDSPEHLEHLLPLVFDAIRGGEPITWGRLAYQMKEATGVCWDADRYAAVRIAVRALTAAAADQTGHVIAVAVVNKAGDNKQFFKDASHLQLLPRATKLPDCRRFWVQEWDWWRDWMNAADADPNKTALSDLEAACANRKAG